LKATLKKQELKDAEEIARIMRGRSDVALVTGVQKPLSEKLHRYGQLLLQSQREEKNKNTELAERLRGDAEIIFHHFQTKVD